MYGFEPKLLFEAQEGTDMPPDVSF